MGARVAPVPQAAMVGHYSHFAEKNPSREVARPAVASPLRRAAEELTLTYDFAGITNTICRIICRGIPSPGC